MSRILRSGRSPASDSLLVAILLCLPANARADSPAAPNVGTFSIVAVDLDTGEIGVAVQSRIVAVGNIVPYAKAGVGAVATQAFANVAYGPIALEAMSQGLGPRECVEGLVDSDPLRAKRQTGIISAEGEAATYTGSDCLSWAGCLTGRGYCVQGNILAGREVIESMARAYEETEGELSERLLAALEAGQRAGGDKRGMQSAALLVVREGWGYGGLNDRFRDLRVDEHSDPIAELRRIYGKHCELFPRPE